MRNSNRHNLVLDEGNNNIPFSAVKEIYKYELFVTNLSLHTDLNVIKSHLRDVLNTEVILKPFRKEGAICLSLGLFFSSEFNNLDMKMPGIWPKGTAIYKWDANRSTYHGNQHNNRTGRNQQGSVSAQGNGNGSSVTPRQNSSQYQNNQRPNNGGFRYKYPDQQRLHDQYV